MRSTTYRKKKPIPKKPPIVFDGTLKRFVDPSDTRKSYMGVHRVMQLMFPMGWSLEALHKDLDARLKTPPQRAGSGKSALEFGALVHSDVACLINMDQWDRKSLDRDSPTFAIIASMMKLLKKLGLRVFKGDLAVKDEPRRLATGADVVLCNGSKYIVVELKVFASVSLADFVDEKTPLLAPPFQNLPCTPGFLAEVQAQLTRSMFCRTYQKRSPAEAAVIIIDRSTRRAHWRPCSDSSRLAARAVLKVMDLKECHSVGQTSAEIFALAAEAKETGEDYEALKRRKGSEELQRVATLTTELTESMFPRDELLGALTASGATRATATKVMNLIFKFLA